MVKFDLVLTDGRIHVETIDDAEGTPGASRQYTRFNAECKPELERALDGPGGMDMTDVMDAILEKHNFVQTGATVSLVDMVGDVVMRRRIHISSVEP